MNKEERAAYLEKKRIRDEANRAARDLFMEENDVQHGEAIYIAREIDGSERYYLTHEERVASFNPYKHIVGSTTRGSSADLWNINNGRPRRLFAGPTASEIENAKASPFIADIYVSSGIVEDEDISGPFNNVTRESLEQYERNRD